MSDYFQTLEQAEQHIHRKKSIEHSRVNWCIIHCTMGFMVVSEAQAYYSFPDSLHDSKDHT